MHGIFWFEILSYFSHRSSYMADMIGIVIWFTKIDEQKKFTRPSHHGIHIQNLGKDIRVQFSAPYTHKTKMNINICASFSHWEFSKTLDDCVFLAEHVSCQYCQFFHLLFTLLHDFAVMRGKFFLSLSFLFLTIAVEINQPLRQAILMECTGEKNETWEDAFIDEHSVSMMCKICFRHFCRCVDGIGCCCCEPLWWCRSHSCRLYVTLYL